MHLKLSKIKRGVKHYLTMKAVRKKLALTGGSRHIRQLKRSLNPNGSVVSPSQPTSATTYQYQPKTISQMTGGV